MTNLIKDIHDFNHKAGLVNGYNDKLEDSLSIEEALEDYDGVRYVNSETSTYTPKEVSREILSSIGEFGGTDVNRLDKACDKFILAVGSMTKLDLHPDQIIRAVGAVVKANQAKLDCPLDDHGKLTKPEGFTGPEDALQLILDERR